MRRRRVDTFTEQRIATAMVVSKEFLSQSLLVVDPDLFEARHLQLISKWCLEYYEQYREAPGSNIESIYQGWVNEGKGSDEMKESLHTVLSLLSKRYDEDGDINVPYLLDTAAAHFDRRRMEVLKDELEYHLTEGDTASATEAIVKFSSTPTKMSMGIDPLNDEDIWDLAFAESQHPLITWDNKAANEFFGNALCRDGLIAVLAPEKRGKTWWCVELVYRAAKQRRKVALFEVGDMSESQIMRRLAVRLSGRPMYRSHLGLIAVPAKIRRTDTGAEVECITEKHEVAIGPKASKKAVRRFMRSNGIRSGVSHVMVSVHANSSVCVQDIHAILDQWEAHRDFVPDVILIDYPDILAPEPGSLSMTTRDQVNTTWKALRRLSQERHCLVIAPTQADATSYGQGLLEASNFSEDKRKLAHVTGMVGLNQTSKEKEEGIMRLNWIVLREGEYNNRRCLHVGQCLRLGRAFCCAC